MARTFTPRVRRLVHYYNAAGKPQPAKIMSTGSVNGGIVLRRLNTTTNIGDATTGILRGSVGPGVRSNQWSPT